MKVRIEGDGTLWGTSVVNAETGERIDYVESVEIEIGADLEYRAVVTFVRPGVSLNIDAEVRDMTEERRREILKDALTDTSLSRLEV